MPEPSMRQRVFPQLRMTNWKRTRAFYVDGLGFSVDWEHRFEPGLPVFAQLTRDGLSLFLTEHAGDCQVGGAAYLVVDDSPGVMRRERPRHVLKRQLGHERLDPPSSCLILSEPYRRDCRVGERDLGQRGEVVAPRVARECVLGRERTTVGSDVHEHRV